MKSRFKVGDIVKLRSKLLDDLVFVGHAVHGDNAGIVLTVPKHGHSIAGFDLLATLYISELSCDLYSFSYDVTELIKVRRKK